MQNYKETKKIAAAIIEKEGRILIARRGKQDELLGKWEFPGGKVEQGETLEQCLKRELMEELGINAEVGEYVTSSTFMHKDNLYEMCMFRVPSFEGLIQLHEHQEIKWVARQDLPNYDYPDPDLPIVSMLINHADKQ